MQNEVLPNVWLGGCLTYWHPDLLILMRSRDLWGLIAALATDALATGAEEIEWHFHHGRCFRTKGIAVWA